MRVRAACSRFNAPASCWAPGAGAARSTRKYTRERPMAIQENARLERGGGGVRCQNKHRLRGVALTLAHAASRRPPRRPAAKHMIASRCTSASRPQTARPAVWPCCAAVAVARPDCMHQLLLLARRANRAARRARLTNSPRPSPLQPTAPSAAAGHATASSTLQTSSRTATKPTRCASRRLNLAAHRASMRSVGRLGSFPLLPASSTPGQRGRPAMRSRSTAVASPIGESPAACRCQPI